MDKNIIKTTLYIVVNHYTDNSTIQESVFYTEDSAKSRIKLIKDNNDDKAYVFSDYYKLEL